MINTKKVWSIEKDDILIWESRILKLVEVNQMSKYSFKATCLFLSENGRFSAKNTTNVRFWHDDHVPYAKTIKEAKKVLAEVSKPEENLPFFVYGTLRKGMGNYENYLIGNTSIEMPATVKGLLFHQGSVIPYMTKGDGIVHGELMYIDDEIFPAILVDLDRLEGYQKNSTWNHYNRERVMAKLEDGTEVEAYAYFYGGGDSYGMYPIAHGDYRRWRITHERMERLTNYTVRRGKI